MSKDLMFPFFVQGISNDGEYNSTGQEYITECLWCSSPQKLYINPHKRVYNCKVCDQSGHYLHFLEEISKYNQKQITDVHLEALALNRGLPIDAFRGYDIGWNGKAFSIPMYDIDGKLINLGLFRPKPGEKIMNSAGSIGMLSASRLIDHRIGPLIVCEGFWDMVAMTWLMKETKEKGTVVGMPGALNNIAPWAHWFHNRHVVVIYDNDAAGIEGEFKIYKELDGKTKTLSFLHWPEKKPNKYDLRDHVVKWQSDPDKAFRLIQTWLHSVPREWANYAVKEQGKLVIDRREKLEPISFKELIESYQSYLYLPNIEIIKVLLGSIYANRFRSSMIWLFIVAPPSSGKSEVILSLQGTPEVEFVSDVSDHAFISGYKVSGGNDPSLLFKLQNRVMAIKDFTPLLAFNPGKESNVFGVLRDVYDGRTDKKYGHGVNPSYTNLHFGIIAGVTNEIEKVGNMQRALGERFLRYHCPIDYNNEDKIINRSLDNLFTEEKKRNTLQNNVLRFLETNKGEIRPNRSEKITELIRSIGKFTSLLRGVVSRDFKERVEYIPSREGGSRISRQLALMATGMACLENKQEIGMEEMQVIKSIALSSCSDFVRVLVKFLYNTGGAYVSRGEMEQQTNIPMKTLINVVDNMRMLNIVERRGATFKSLYGLSAITKQLIQEGEIFPEKKKVKVYLGA